MQLKGGILYMTQFINSAIGDAIQKRRVLANDIVSVLNDIKVYMPCDSDCIDRIHLLLDQLNDYSDILKYVSKNTPRLPALLMKSKAL